MCHYLGAGHHFTSRLLEKETLLRCCSLNILNGVHQLCMPAIGCVEETNHKRNSVAPVNIFTEEIHVMK